MKQDREEATVAIVSTFDDSNPRAMGTSIFVKSKGTIRYGNIVYGKDIFLSMISHFQVLCISFIQVDMDTLKFSVGFSTCINHRESVCERILNMTDIFMSMSFYLWKSCILFQDEEDYRLHRECTMIERRS